MAELRDEHGNPIQLTDQYGKPVRLTDEYGNPMHLTGVATTHQTAGEVADAPPPVAAPPQQPQEQEQLQRSGSPSSNSSSEDDGQGGRRKKKGLKEKINNTLGGGAHKDKDEAAHCKDAPTPSTTTPHSQTQATTVPGGKAPEHKKKGLMEKIKEKLPGHHGREH